MNILVVGRTLPKQNTGSFGLFEFQQAKAISKYENTGFLFVDNSSILSQRTVKKIIGNHDDILTVGIYLPIKGLPLKIYDNIRTKLFVQAFNEFTKKYWKPDIIHVHFPLLTLNSQILDFLKEQNAKLIVTEHWSNVLKKELSKKQVDLLKKILKKSDSYICVSEDLKTSVKEITSYNGDKLIVIPNMVSNVFFQNQNKYSRSTKEFTFTYIGRLTDIKRLDLLITAFLRTFRAKNNVKLVIVGDGPEKVKLERMIPKDSEDAITFVGNQPKEKVAEYLNNTAVYVSASNLETFGVPFIEAMAMGIPVIGADNLPIANLINDQNGILFRVDDEKDLSDKLKYMYKNRENYNGSEIKEDIEKRFSTENVAKMILKIY